MQAERRGACPLPVLVFPSLFERVAASHDLPCRVLVQSCMPHAPSRARRHDGSDLVSFDLYRCVVQDPLLINEIFENCGNAGKVKLVATK
eukprot:726751-Pleurochrysis_carterae.AAC.1